ncbi:MAG: hypothetical protein CME62_02430 [Halobacteriovoraceae bacterium]|nr:hypothetical protein [Halobacteriovoraceae bacterium]|tara:strand:+ start:6679 stop:7386 length:708 start_codon:yes stop_codon:yes gene_type:complete
MKKKLLVFLIFVLCGLFIIAVFNTIQFSAKEDYLKTVIEETYFKPRVFSELTKSSPQKAYPVDSQKLNLNQLIEKNSTWKLEFIDLTLIREDWHYQLYDYLKRKNVENPDQVLREYFTMKQFEIENLRSTEQHFEFMLDEYLERNENRKDAGYYKLFQKQLKIRKKREEEIEAQIREAKIELFGRHYPVLVKLNNLFNQNLNERLATEYNFKPSEIEDFRKKALRIDDKLIYLAL